MNLLPFQEILLAYKTMITVNTLQSSRWTRTTSITPRQRPRLCHIYLQTCPNSRSKPTSFLISQDQSVPLPRGTKLLALTIAFSYNTVRTPIWRPNEAYKKRQISRKWSLVWCHYGMPPTIRSFRSSYQRQWTLKYWCMPWWRCQLTTTLFIVETKRIFQPLTSEFWGLTLWDPYGTSSRS